MSAARHGAAAREAAAPVRARPAWVTSLLKAASAGSVVAILAIIGVKAGPRTNAAQASTLVSSSSAQVASAFAAAPLVTASGTSSASATPAASSSAPMATSGTLPDGRVVLNLATEEDLVKLRGVGPTRAKAILTLRERLGGKFKSINDLLRVKGLGRKTLERLRPSLLLDTPPVA